MSSSEKQETEDRRASLERMKLLALKEFAYGASHEINNPLANIASRAQLLLKGESDPERRRALATIHSQAMRAHEMIADLMLFAKPPQLQQEWVAVGDWCAAWRQWAQEHGPDRVEIRWPSEWPPWTTLVDRRQLLVALQAITRNAWEAMEGEGAIAVQLVCGDEHGPAQGSDSSDVVTARWLWVSIQDDGPGLSEPVRAHLFDPFFSGREAGRGLGFGLSKAWRIVDQHQGVIRVESPAPGEGSCFWIGLPTLTG